MTLLKKHPRGLVFIFFTEMWERVGFYTLIAILVLYMDKSLGFPDARKGDIYGLFLALCYFMPLLGGWLGDRVLGRRTTVKIGAGLMALGYVGLALSSAGRTTPFFLGLLLVGVGTGIFKVNMAVMVGNLYAGRPQLKDAAFNIFYMGVNLGAMIAPLGATLVSVVWGNYNISFWICAAGLVFSLVIFQAGDKAIAPADFRGAPQEPPSVAVHAPAAAVAPAEERSRVVALVLLYFIVIFFWTAFYQNGFALTLFAERSTKAFSWLRPETYQFFEPAFILILTPLLLALFARWNARGREPSTPLKIFSGLLIMSLSMLVMVLACLAGGNKDVAVMSPLWLIGTYFLVTLAEILISPMGQSYVSKVAPPRLAGLMMGGWFAATAVGSYGSGLLGKSYGRFAHHQYFLLLVGLLAVSAGLILVFIKKLRRFAG
ncbi:MAG: peptide MFS transporter [Acidobacteriota bacterium]|nr:peptide MFS transporter [Acidobacteriota bacterium]